MHRLLIFCILFTFFTAYTLFVYTKGTEVIPDMNEDAYEGKKLFQRYNCGTCHQIYGLGGYLGPELTDIVSRPGKTGDYLKARMKTGVAQMPEMDLSETETSQILAYLVYINQTVPDYKKSK